MAVARTRTPAPISLLQLLSSPTNINMHSQQLFFFSSFLLTWYPSFVSSHLSIFPNHICMCSCLHSSSSKPYRIACRNIIVIVSSTSAAHRNRAERHLTNGSGGCYSERQTSSLAPCTLETHHTMLWNILSLLQQH